MHFLKLLIINVGIVICSGITEDDLRKTAFEILLAAVGASGYFVFLICIDLTFIYMYMYISCVILV